MPAITPTELRRLHAAHADGLFRYFWTATRRVCEAEDLVQEFFVKLARGGDAVLAAVNERAWLYTTARNMALDWHRRHTKQAEVSTDDQLELLEYSSAADDPHAAGIGRELAAAMARLPEEQRTVAQLRLWGNFSLREMNLTMPPASVDS